MAVFNNSSFDDHERVLFCRDARTGLHAIIAIHSTVLGPAAGGCRMWQYASEDAAITDVLRLARGMSYKNAMAGLRMGGGKAVILKSADFVASEALFERYGEFVDSLHGDYVTAEDVGMTVDVMQMVARRTRYVAGLPSDAGKAGGDPSPKTSWGIFKGIEAAVKHRLSKDSVAGLTVAVQGVGNVGYHLCRYLHKAGASLVVADIDQARVARVCQEFSAQSVGLDAIVSAAVDVLAPCALGAVLTEASIPTLRASIVAGGANNQLEVDEDGERLRDRGILYAPDYVINGGGIINVASEYFADASDEEVVQRVAEIGSRLQEIFIEADATGKSTNEVADARARSIIAAAGH